MDGSFRDWAWLPPLFVNMMVAKLYRCSDYVRFSGVCPQWRCVALETNVDHKVNLDLLKASRGKLPMLLFNTDENNDESRSLYSVVDGKTYTVKLPLPYKKRFIGSSFGWLFCVNEDTMVTTLVNPYKNSLITLPVFQDPGSLILWHNGKNFDYYIVKVILSSDPHVSENSWEVVALYGGMARVAFFKPGMPAWELLPDRGNLLTDLIYHKGKLYGISKFMELFEIDLQSKTRKLISPRHDKPISHIYLVESQHAELLMITRRWDKYDEECSTDEDDWDDEDDCDDEPNITFEFKVFKMTHPIEKGTVNWVLINNIGQQALFLGENQSVCVSTTESPGCQPNSIYYAVETHANRPYTYNELGEDSGFFNLDDGRFYKHHVLGSSDKYVQPSIWCLPTPQKLD